MHTVKKQSFDSTSSLSRYLAVFILLVLGYFLFLHYDSYSIVFAMTNKPIDTNFIQDFFYPILNTNEVKSKAQINSSINNLTEYDPNGRPIVIQISQIIIFKSVLTRNLNPPRKRRSSNPNPF